MNRIKCIVADDEPLQLEIVKDYIRETETLELLGAFSDGEEVLSFLHSSFVDVLFLDINMPILNGVELVKRLANPPAIIFTTAYAEYAVEGFNLNAVDYLLKPISYGRFKEAVEKLLIRLDKNVGDEFIFIRSDRKDYKVRFDEIIYCEAMGDYIKMHLIDKVLTFHSTMQKLEKKLPEKEFVRIHKSYIVSMSRIDYVENQQLAIAGVKLVIGNHFKTSFDNTWKKY